MSQTFKLFRLQQIDSQLDRARVRLKEIESALNDDSEVRQAKQKAESIQSLLHESTRALHRSEQEVQAQNIKIEQTEAALYGGRIHNPKELQDLQNESAALKRFLAVLEDRQLEAMIAFEETETDHQAAITELEKVMTSTASYHDQLCKEQETLLKDVTRLEEEGQAAASTIDPQDLHLYTQLRQQRAGVAVAKVVDRACSACGSTLSAALLSSALSPSQVTRCATCGRILYAG